MSFLLHEKSSFAWSFKIWKCLFATEINLKWFFYFFSRVHLPSRFTQLTPYKIFTEKMESQILLRSIVHPVQESKNYNYCAHKISDVQQKSWCQADGANLRLDRFFSQKVESVEFCSEDLPKLLEDFPPGLVRFLFEIYQESNVLCDTFFRGNNATENSFIAAGGQGMVCKCECADCGVEPSLTAQKGIGLPKHHRKPTNFLRLVCEMNTS